MKRVHSKMDATSAPPSVEASSISSDQPMATSTPGRSSHRTNILNEELSLSPAARENVELSPSTAAAAVVTPTQRPRDVANSSLPQRVPRTFQQIMGRRPVHSGFKSTMSSKGRVSKFLKINSPIAPKSEHPKKIPKHTETEADGRSLPYSPEGTLPEESSTSADAARVNSGLRLTPSAAPACPYKVLQLSAKNRPIGLLILNMDSLKQQVPNPAEMMRLDLDLHRIEVTNDEDTPPPENPDNNTSHSLPKNVPPKTKNCLIM